MTCKARNNSLDMSIASAISRNSTTRVQKSMLDIDKPKIQKSSMFESMANGVKKQFKTAKKFDRS